MTYLKQLSSLPSMFRFYFHNSFIYLWCDLPKFEFQYGFSIFNHLCIDQEERHIFYLNNDFKNYGHSV